ncbi:MAG: DNA polymerase III subunit gamma and tau [Streptosporangiaceae bacterium]|jgi:DNA polymerase-3 subunit gamma/tau
MAGDVPSPSHDPGPADAPRPEAPAAPLALYRRYRPATFAEVKGQEHVTEPLRQALRSGRVHHAYLFSGPRGCGKTSSARILARSLNCENGPTPDPCGECASCVALAPAGPGSIDVIEIDAASHGGVDDARDLRERAFYAPVSGRFKVYIIDEAHMVTREGFNALLKLVEEPPPHLKFVFATTEPEKVIATIRSRTHHYPFRLVPPAVLRELLEKILAAEGVRYEPAVLPVVIRAGAGSVRDSLSVLDQLMAGSDESGLTYDRAIALLGFTDERLLDDVAEAFAARDGAAVFRAIDRVVEAGHDPRRFAADLLDRLRDLIVLAAVPDAGATGLLDVPADRLERMQEQADGLGQSALTRAAEIVSAGLVEMRGATSPRLQLELMCAQVLLPPASPADGGLLERLERLERRLGAGEAEGRAVLPRARPPQAAPGPPAELQPRAAGAPAPGSRAPGTPAPGQQAPAAQSSGARAPGAQAPGAQAPGAQAPGAQAPGAQAPGAQAQRQQAPAPPPPAPAGEPAAAEAAHARAAQAEPSAAGPAGAGNGSARVDAATLRERWPDVLDGVRNTRKVAWILLSNASVESLADGVLTVAFSREGDAKGFQSSGCDRELGQVLQAMFGVCPQIRTIARGGNPPGGRGAGGTAPDGGGPFGHGGPAAGVVMAAGSGRPEGSSRPEGSGRPEGPGRPEGSGRSAGRAGPPPAGTAGHRPPGPPPGPARPAEPPGGDPADTDPADELAPGELTGTDLIERELGGRVIEEIGGS